MTATARSKAWATRRAKYGSRGHAGAYSRQVAPVVINIENIGGYCPVQAEGTVNGVEFYFRARHAHWRMNVGGPDVVLRPAWTQQEPYGEGPHDAGWMELDEALAFIKCAARAWAADRASHPAESPSPQSEAKPSAGNQATDDLNTSSTSNPTDARFSETAKAAEMKSEGGAS